MMIRLCEVERKLDMIIDKLDQMNGVRAFGSDILANVIGNVIVR
jgi:hypothetical protein